MCCKASLNVYVYLYHSIERYSKFNKHKHIDEKQSNLWGYRKRKPALLQPIKAQCDVCRVGHKLLITLGYNRYKSNRN